MTVLIFIGSIDSLIQQLYQSISLPRYFHLNFLINSFYSDAVTSFLPLLATLPFSANYLEDSKNKFIRFYLIRCDYRSYLCRCIWGCFLCGSSVVFIGGLLSWFISAVVFLPMEKQMGEEIYSAPVVWMALGLLSLTGGLWSVVGIAMSTFMESKYIAYASPFVIYYFLVILCERYFTDAYLLYPPNWTKPDIWPYGFWGAAIFLLELTLAFGILFAIRAGRRLQQL